MTRSFSVCVALLLLSFGGTVGPAHGQNDDSREDGCTILCSPELKVEPAVDIEPLSEAPRTVAFDDGQPLDTTQGDLEATFEFTLAMDIPTQWSRVELGLDAAWTPFVDTEEHPFTGRSGSMTENPVELAGEVSVTVLREKDTRGRMGVDVVVADEFGPAERPDANRWYTHKLAFSLEAAVLPLHRLEGAGYFRGVEVEGSIDYAATGVPKEGDRFPDELFLDDASPWGLSVALALPVAPR